MAERKLPKEWQGKPVPSIEGKNDLVVEERCYQLITPLFGGGVEPNTPDPVTVIRATEIRGHLRFWWRATRGGQFETIAKLKEAEDLIWGAASKKGYERPSLVQIAIKKITDGKKEAPYYVEKGRNGKPKVQFHKNSFIPQYAGFPLQPSTKDPNFDVGMETSEVVHGVTFSLEITYPVAWITEDTLFQETLKQELNATLWAWETFGGIGSRTRRGFGTIRLTEWSINGLKQPLDIPIEKDNVKPWITSNIIKYSVDTYRHSTIPMISKNIDIRVVYASNKARISWNSLIDKLKEFRQQRAPAPKSNPKRPGRSFWPEPDSIRIETNGKHQYHKPRLKMRKFPRSAFGLPIIFKFNDLDVSLGDPQQTTLQGDAKINRLASPLLLRPFHYISNGEIYYVGLAVRLEAPILPPGGLTLEINGKKRPVDSNRLNTEDIDHLLPALDLPKRNADVLTAFLDYLEQ